MSEQAKARTKFSYKGFEVTQVQHPGPLYTYETEGLEFNSAMELDNWIDPRSKVTKSTKIKPVAPPRPLPPIKPDKPPKERHAELSWRILELKILYYQCPVALEDYAENNLPSDDEYDRLEQEYLKLCLELGVENTLVHKGYAGLDVPGEGMMEIDWSRPSVDNALERLYILAGLKEDPNAKKVSSKRKKRKSTRNSKKAARKP